MHHQTDVALKMLRNIYQQVDFVFFAKRKAITFRDGTLPAFVKKHLDVESYLKAYQDVKSAGLDPVLHWLRHGITEGRFLSRRAIVKLGDEALRVKGDDWHRFTWNGTHIAIRIRPERKSVIEQILAQGEHEPGVLAPGALAISSLPEFDAPDLLARDGVDYKRIFSTIPKTPDVVIVMPFLCAGGAEKYAADLACELACNGQKSVLVLVTEHSAKEAAGWEKLQILAPFKSASIVFWREVCGPSFNNPMALARLLNALRPSCIVINNSRVGLEAVARFGRGISQFSKIYCTYFSSGIQGLGGPYGVRFPSKTLPFSTAITDNTRMAATLSRLWGGLSHHTVEVLPAKLPVANGEIFNRRLAARQARVSCGTRSLRWVWISRIEPFKGTAILAAIARMRPSDTFDIYGPVEGSLKKMGLMLPNVCHKGVLPSVADADLKNYDGFIFTSLFEGMPNVVLEISQHAIPMVLADVGGLRNTFKDESAIYVSHALDENETAASFNRAMNTIANLTEEQVKVMVEKAYLDAVRCHAPDAYTKNVTKLFRIEPAHV